MYCRLNTIKKKKKASAFFLKNQTHSCAKLMIAHHIEIQFQLFYSSTPIKSGSKQKLVALLDRKYIIL